MPKFTRLLLITFMLVLLPLRGWTGDVMSVNMAASTLSQAKMDNMSSQASMPADCAMHSPPSADNVASFCNNCDTCELCLVVANLTPTSWLPIQNSRHSSPLMLNAGFSSANSASHLKPPIS